MSKAEASDHRSITSRDLINIRDIGGHNLTAINGLGALSVSPNRGYVAFQLQVPNLESRAYDLSWRILETRPEGKSWIAGDGGEIVLNRNAAPAPGGSRSPVKAQWSPDSRWIYYLKRLHGITQVWRSRFDGDVIQQLTHHAGDIMSFRLSADGKVIYFTAANAEEEMSRQLQDEGDRGFLYDERFQPNKRKSPYARICGVDGSGYVRMVGIARACDPPLWVFDVSAKSQRKATDEDTEAFQRLLTVNHLGQIHADSVLLYAGDDGSAIWVQNDDPEKFIGIFPPMHLFASQKSKEFRCSAKECAGHKGIIEGAWMRASEDEVIFQRADGWNGSMTGLYAWKLGSERVRTIIKTEDQLGDCQILASRAVCLREQWTYPRTIVSIDLENGRIKTTYDPNLEFDKIIFSNIEKIEWKDEFGNPTYAHLVYPLDYEPRQRYPLVITTYSSRGFLRGAVGDEYPIHVLAANGFMVLSHHMPRARSHYAFATGYFGEFKDNYERRSTLSAQERILDILDARGLIDPARVAITGLSDGESQVKFALTHTNRFAAAITSGARDYGALYYTHNRPERAFWRSVLGGTPYEDREGLYNELSIGLNAEKVNAPLLVNVSDHELIESVESVARLQDAGKPVEMYVFPNEFHNKWQPQHRLAIYRRNIQWLRFWLMGEEEDNPVSPGQYFRWRKMRGEQCERLKDQDSAPWYCRQ